MRGHFGYGNGDRDTGVDLEMQLIKTSLPMAYILHPPNPAKGTLPLARSPFPVALLYRQTQIYIGIAMHHCMLGANSAGDIFSSECVNLLQNKTAMLAHKAAMLAQSRCRGRRSLYLSLSLSLSLFSLSLSLSLSSHLSQT